MTRFALFYQSLVSDWNHGNAHFLRGLMRALQARGHTATCYEQSDNWSLTNLLSIKPSRDRRVPGECSRTCAFETYALADVERFLRERLAGAD